MANKKNVDSNVVKKTKEEVKEMAVAKHRFSQKNILIAFGIIIVLLLIGIYIYKWVKVKDEEKYMNSYLISSGTINLEMKNLDEVKQILTEAPNEYFILITYTGDKDTYTLETGVKKIIDEYALSDSFYYLNIESIMEEDNYLTRLNNAFNTDKITTVPIILYFKEGKLVDTVTRDDNNVINAGDFQKLLDIYEYEGQ